MLLENQAESFSDIFQIKNMSSCVFKKIKKGALLARQGLP